jgi:DNA-binding CsgD family transcriptional regulator
MKGIPEATAIILTTAERTELERLARSTKTEHRLRQRARIVLLAAEGLASRAIGRAVGCTTGTVSKWRMRYAEKRIGGLDETGDRGAKPRYTAETDKRILALLDQPKPKGYPGFLVEEVSPRLFLSDHGFEALKHRVMRTLGIGAPLVPAHPEVRVSSIIVAPIFPHIAILRYLLVPHPKIALRV